MLSWACILCGYELHAQAVSLVQAHRTRPSMARDAQSVCHPRVGVHATADAGQPGFGILPSVSEAISHVRLARALATQSCDGSMGWPGLLRSSPKSPPARARGYPPARRHVALRSGVPEDTPRCRAVHSGSGGVLCLREACPDRRYERAQSIGASVWLEGCVGARRAARPEEGRASVEIQSGAHGARSARVYGAKAEVPRVPG